MSAETKSNMLLSCIILIIRFVLIPLANVPFPHGGQKKGEKIALPITGISYLFYPLYYGSGHDTSKALVGKGISTDGLG